MASSRPTPELLAARAARRALTQWVEGQSYRLVISGFSSWQAARWVRVDDVRKQNQFIDKLFDLAA